MIGNVISISGGIMEGKSCKQVLKTYYVFVHDSTDEPAFKRCAYILQNSSNYRVVIQYKGDESVAVDSKSHLRTCPHDPCY